MFCLVVAIYLLATKTSFLLRVYGTSFDENCGTACLEALQQQCAAPTCRNTAGCRNEDCTGLAQIMGQL